MNPDPSGVVLAVASGSLASGVGYAIWYAALPGLRVASASTVQLSVPLITAIGGVLLLGEAIGVGLVIASIAILAGILVVVLGRSGPRAARSSST